MTYNADVFSHQYVEAEDFIHHLWQYRELERQLTPSRRTLVFFPLSSMAHMKQAVIHWCKVFGSFNEKTHWNHLSAKDSSATKRSFRAGISMATGRSLNEWDCYAKAMPSFRDTYVAHTDIHRKPVAIPHFDFALDIVFYYDSWVRRLIAPDIIDAPTLREMSNNVRLQTSHNLEALLAAAEANGLVPN